MNILAELKAKKTPELIKMVRELRDEVRDLRFKISQNQHKQVRDIRKKKRTVAQILSIIQDREKANHLSK